MKKTFRPQSLSVLLAAGLVMTSCSQQPSQEIDTESSVEQTVQETTEETAAPFTPVELTEDYSGPVLGIENWHLEQEDLSWGSMTAINVFVINDDTGMEIASYGGLGGVPDAYLTDLNADGQPELVCNSSWGSEHEIYHNTCIFRSNDGIIEIAYPCYGDLEDSSFTATYPYVAEVLGVDINVRNSGDYSDSYDPETDRILLVNSVDSTEYEIGYECLQFSQYIVEDPAESGDGGSLPSDDIDIVYETAEPVVTDISETEKAVTFLRDGMEIEGKLFLPEGDGPFPVIVLSCGLMQPYSDYEEEAQRFADNGYAAVVFSFIDYSDPDGEVPAPDEFGTVFLSETRDLYAVMDSLDLLPEVDSGNVYLWGHSFGGFVSAFAGCDRASGISGLILVEPSLVIGEELPVTYEDGSRANLRIYDLLGTCELDTAIYMGTHDGYGDDPHSFDQAIGIMPSCELVIIDGADHFFEGEYGEAMVDDACGKIASWNA